MSVKVIRTCDRTYSPYLVTHKSLHTRHPEHSPFSSNCSCVFTYSVGNVMQISMPPVIPPAIIPFTPVPDAAAAAAPLFSIHGRIVNGFLFGVVVIGNLRESIFVSFLFRFYQQRDIKNLQYMLEKNAIRNRHERIESGTRGISGQKVSSNCSYRYI